MSFPKIASLRTPSALRAHLESLGVELPCDDDLAGAAQSPLAAPLGCGRLGNRERDSPNRFAIQPMEGWDGTEEGLPTELTIRRWRNFGISGAGLIWGGEAVAVRADARANPNQLVLSDTTANAIGELRRELLAAAGEVGVAPIVGLQLTHSGRWARSPSSTYCSGARGQSAPRVAFRHPLLDARVGVRDDAAVLTDKEVDEIVASFAAAARLAQEEGFDFVDIKHCHGYLLHEFLSARSRSGRWGGESFDDRTALLRAMIAAVKDAAPGIGIGVRLSAFDTVPHHPEGRDDLGHLGPGVPDASELPYRCGFGVDSDAPTRMDLREPIALTRELVTLGVRLINITGGSPYYCPHVQRPAAFPPSDGYAPPEDPLVGVARLLRAAKAMKAAVPEAVVVSSGWSYLQDFLPHVAQACVREGWFDSVGLGRMVLSYPQLPADVLAGKPLLRRAICRTFSDCTTAPRQGLESGCYPLDPFYRQMPQRSRLEELKQAGRPRG